MCDLIFEAYLGGSPLPNPPPGGCRLLDPRSNLAGGLPYIRSISTRGIADK